MSTVLIVDDEKNYLVVIEDLLLEDGYEVLTTSSPAAALEILQSTPVDCVLSDIKMPGMSGIELLDRINALDSDLPVILMTAFAEVDQAVSAMKKGALDHIQKPFDNVDVKRAVARGVEKRSLVRNIRHLETELGTLWGNIIGKSKAMEKVLTIMKRAADTPTTVLICGESGTGKELVARGLHKASSRCDNPFVSINCGAVPENLLESELFGYEKGAFTGANSLKQGKFEFASGGAIFLDEVGRDASDTPGEAASRAPGTGIPTSRRKQRYPRGCPYHRSNEQESERRGRRGSVPRRSVFPPQCGEHRGAASQG